MSSSVFHARFLIRTALAACLLAGALDAAPALADAGGVGAAARQPAAPDAVLVNPPGGSELLDANTYAADALHAVMASRVGTSSPILVATLADVDNLERSTPFGRTTMQQVASRLGQHGYRVLDARLGRAMTFSPQGEFMLSRDATRLMQAEYDAQAALVGTYAVAGSTAYISLRVVRLDDAAIMAAYEYHVPVRGDARRLLASQGDPWSQHVGRRQAFAGAGVPMAAVAPAMQAAPSASPAAVGRVVQPAPSAAVPMPLAVVPGADPAAMPLLKDFPPIGARADAGGRAVAKTAPQKQKVAKAAPAKPGKTDGKSAKSAGQKAKPVPKPAPKTASKPAPKAAPQEGTLAPPNGEKDS